MVKFIIGFIVGVICGVTLMCMAFIAKRSDRKHENSTGPWRI